MSESRANADIKESDAASAQAPVSEEPKDEHGNETATNSATERKIRGIPWFIVNVSLLSATFLYALDNTVTATVRPAIVQSFGRRIDMLTWVSVAYPMGEVGANPLWAKLNKLFNGKVIFLIALLIFEVGSAVIGSAQSLASLVAGRAVAGFGGSGIYVSTITIISGMTGAAEQNQYLNIVGVAWSLGTILGPVVGSAFADSTATWRWAFYINICVAAVAAPACIAIMPSIPPPVKLGLVASIRAVDYLGAVLFLGAVVSTVMLLGFGGAVYGWGSGQMIALYITAVVLWLIFSLQQRFRWLTVDRVFPAQFVGDVLMVILFAWTAIAISSIVVTIYTLPLFFQFVLRFSSMKSAVYTLPFVFSVVLSAGISGQLLLRFPWYKYWFVWASVLVLISSGLLTAIDANTAPGAVCGYTVLQGFGVGPVIQLGYTVARLKRPRALLSDISAFMSCAQMGGLALSLGIATCVLVNKATGQVAAILPGVARDEIQAMIDGANDSLLETLSASVRGRVVAAVASSVGDAFYLNLAGAALGLAVAVPMRHEKLDFAQLQ